MSKMEYQQSNRNPRGGSETTTILGIMYGVSIDYKVSEIELDIIR